MDHALQTRYVPLGKSSPQENQPQSLFVKDIVDFSSQYGKENSIAYTVHNLRGEPTQFPNYGDFTSACVLRTYGPWWSMLPSTIKLPKTISQHLFISKDFIEVSFAHKIKIESIFIYETYNPGAVVSIFAYDYTKSRWTNIWSVFDEGFTSNRAALNRPLPEKTSRQFSPHIKQTNIYTDLVRLEFEDSMQYYYTELDAVEIIGRHVDSVTTRLVANNLNKVATLFENMGISSKEQQKQLPVEYKLTNTDSNSKVKKTTPTTTQTSATASVTTCSNLADLPDEILFMLLSYLDLKSTFRLRACCKRLYHVCSDELLYKVVDLQPCWHLANDQLVALLAKLCGNCVMLSLAWTKLYATQSLVNLFATVSSSLKVLKLDNCAFIDGPMLIHIAKTCSQLTQLSLASCQNINPTTTPDAFTCLKELGSLENLNLYRTHCDQPGVLAIATHCTRLKHLNLDSCIYILDFDEVLAQLAATCPDLESLGLWRAPTVSSYGITKLAEGCRKLRELDVGWCRRISLSECMEPLAKNCRDLRKLFFTSLQVTDIELGYFAKYLKNLEQLDILGAHLISFESIINLMDNCPNMKFFDISFCNKVSRAEYANLCSIYKHCAFKKSFVTLND